MPARIRWRSGASTRSPVAVKAKRYVAAGNFYWNSGMFFWRADVLLDQLRQHLPKTATILAALPPFGVRSFAAKLKQAFPLCDNISIDYAVLEKAANVSGIAAADFGWNDVGSWNAVFELLDRDSSGNAIALRIGLRGLTQQLRGRARQSWWRFSACRTW